ncbi:MAG TPA: hypothetical protein VK970_00320, partial [Candidatus Methylacidiphilales bacterium]|nr:hypothetical protein [Candidatus Methylacidiphilales bacterium]
QTLIGTNPGSLLGDSSVALSVMHYSHALPQSRLALIPKSIPVFVPINVCEWSNRRNCHPPYTIKGHSRLKGMAWEDEAVAVGARWLWILF